MIDRINVSAYFSREEKFDFRTGEYDFVVKIEL